LSTEGLKNNKSNNNNNGLCCLKAQPGHPGAVMGQPAGVGWPQAAQPQMIGMTQPTPQQSMRPVNTPNDPFGSL